MTATTKTKPTKARPSRAETAVSGANAAKPKTGAPRPTKKALLLKRLKTRKGATLQQLSDEFDWQPHTVRAAISRLRSAGFDVTRGEGKEASIYRIAA